MNRKKIGISFVIGVLLCGLGCGIAFAQYSGFDYAGDRVIGEENMVSESVEQSIDKDSDIHVYPAGRYYKTKIVADATVPLDKIIFNVEYNSDIINLNINKVEREKNESCDEKRTDFYLGDYTNSDELKELFMVKDELLNDLKNKKLGSYIVIDFKNIEARVNPENYDRVDIF